MKFNAKGQVEGALMAAIQIRDNVPRVIFPVEAREVTPVFPWPEYKRT